MPSFFIGIFEIIILGIFLGILIPNSWLYHSFRYETKIINKNDSSISELIILPNYLNDAIFGTYQCIAENQFGSDSNIISFMQAWQPAKPNVNVSKVGSGA